MYQRLQFLEGSNPGVSVEQYKRAKWPLVPFVFLYEECLTSFQGVTASGILDDIGYIYNAVG